MDLHFIYIWCLIKFPPNDDVRVQPMSWPRINSVRRHLGILPHGVLPVLIPAFDICSRASRARALPQSVSIPLIKPYVLVHACCWRLHLTHFFLFPKSRCFMQHCEFCVNPHDRCFNGETVGACNCDCNLFYVFFTAHLGFASFKVYILRKTLPNLQLSIFVVSLFGV